MLDFVSEAKNNHRINGINLFGQYVFDAGLYAFAVVLFKLFKIPLFVVHAAFDQVAEVGIF